MSDHDKLIEETTKKTYARAGSQWNSNQRKSQKGFTQPKGFARGASVKCVTKPVTSEKLVK